MGSITKRQLDWSKIDDLGLKGVLADHRWAIEDHEGPLDCVLDLGAHVGFFSFRAAELGAGMVFAVEPEPRNFRVLCKNIVALGLWGTVIPLPFALGLQSWDVSHLGYKGNSGMVSTTYRSSTQTPQPVRALSLTRLLGMLPYDVDHAKVDIEGTEWLVFQPRPDTHKVSDDVRLAMRKVASLEMETHQNPGGKFFPDGLVNEDGLYDFFEQCGFEGARVGEYDTKLFHRIG